MQVCMPLGAVAIVLVVTACAGAPQPYNNIKGYQIISQLEADVALTYTDEARKGELAITDKAIKACAQLLNVKPTGLRYSMGDKRQYHKDVFYEVMIPSVSSDPVAAKGVGGAPSQEVSLYHRTKIPRNIAFITLTAKCSKL